MKQILKIGYTEYVLPASANVNGLLKTLAQARTAQRDPLKPRSFDHYVAGEQPNLELKVVKDSHVRAAKNAEETEQIG